MYVELLTEANYSAIEVEVQHFWARIHRYTTAIDKGKLIFIICDAILKLSQEQVLWQGEEVLYIHANGCDIMANNSV